MCDLTPSKAWPPEPLSTFIAELESGVSVNADDRTAVGEELGVLKTSCVVRGRFLAHEHKAIWPKDVHRARVSPRAGSIIVSRMNTPALVGEAGLVEKSEPGLFLPDRLWQTVLRPEAEADAEWLNHVLNWESIRKAVRDIATGTSNSMKNIAMAQFLAIRVPSPPQRERRRIAELLSAAEDQIASVEDEISKRKLHYVGVQRALLSCATLGAAEVDDVLLRELIPSVQYGISTSLETSGVVPVLRMNNLGAGEVDVSDLKYSPRMVRPELLLKDGDVLFNRTNSMEHVGRTSIWRSQIAEATFASYLVRLFPDEGRITKAYLVYLLGWEEHQTQMRRFATPGVQQVNINPTNLRLCRVQVPRSLKVQQRAVEALDACREYIAALTAEVEKLRLKKRGLAMDLLAGSGEAPT